MLEAMKSHLCAFITGPLDKILKLTLAAFINLGVEDLGDLIFGFTINSDRRLRQGDLVREVIQS